MDKEPYSPGTMLYFWTWPPEIRARVERVSQRAIEVFGNSVKAGVWESRFDPAVAGGREQIREAIKTEEGMHEALAELDRLAPLTVPETNPAWMKRRPRRGR